MFVALNNYIGARNFTYPRVSRSMHYIAVISSFLALVIASPVDDIPPFQASCRVLDFNYLNITAECDNGTPNWTHNYRYWGDCVGLTAYNKMVYAAG